MDRLRRSYLFAAAVAASFGAATLLLSALAPQVFVLWREGFPPPVLPDSGAFALVEGEAQAPPVSLALVQSSAAERFAEAEGRALIVDRGDGVIRGLYGPGVTADTQLNSYSLVKSLVGVLVLRAVTEERFAGLDTRLPDVLGPEWSYSWAIK